MSGVPLPAWVRVRLSSCSFSPSIYRLHAPRRRKSSSWGNGTRRLRGDKTPLNKHARGDALGPLEQGSVHRGQGRNAVADNAIVRTLSSKPTPVHPPVPQELGSNLTPLASNFGEDNLGKNAIEKTARRYVVHKPEEVHREAGSTSSEPPSLDRSAVPEYLERENDDPLEKQPGLDYKSLLRQSLRKRRPADLLRALVAAGDDLEYLWSIPDTTFSELLTLVRPVKLIDWASILRKNLTPHMIAYMAITPPDHLINNYLQAILQVVINRKKAGRVLNVNDYSTLLRTAYTARSKPVAKAVWESMKSDKVTPDLRCFNSYLGAIVQNAGNHAKQLYRVTELHRLARSVPRSGADFVDYRFGEGGIREETLSILEQILKSELQPDTETFRLVILGVAREGDISMVKGILKTTWGVDVSALVDNVDESYLNPRTNILQDSPLCLQGDVLHAVAHAFGINNDVSTAFRVVDYMSRVFDIPISKGIWEEMFERTFVLATPRTGAKEFKFTDGQIDKENLSKLWKTMTSKPYNVRPSIRMYDMMIRMSLHQKRTADIWRYMQEGLVLYKHSRSRAQAARARLEKAVALHEQEGIRPQSQVNMYKRKADFALSELVRKRDRVLVSRWCRTLLASMRSQSTRDRDQFWSIVQIPAILHEMRMYMPRVVEYDTPGGHVRILFQRGMIALGDARIKATKEREMLLNMAPMLSGSALEIGKKLFRRGAKERAKQQRVEGGIETSIWKEELSNAIPTPSEPATKGQRSPVRRVHCKKPDHEKQRITGNQPQKMRRLSRQP